MLRKSPFILRRGVRQGSSGGGSRSEGGLGAAGLFSGEYSKQKEPKPGGGAFSPIGGGDNSSPQAQAEQAQSLESMRKRAIDDGAGELGLTKEEFEARKIRATSPYKVKREKGGEISVLSSARASQIMTEGAIERTSNRETAEISKRNQNIKYFNYGMIITGLTMATFVALAWLKPVIDMRNRRYRQQKRRHEEFFLPALEALEREKEQEREMLQAAAKAGVALPGSPLPPSASSAAMSK